MPVKIDVTPRWHQFSPFCCGGQCGDLFLPRRTDGFDAFYLADTLVALVAGVSYEIIKVSSKHQSLFFWRVLSLPGLMLQRLTTREPDDDQLEVAILALKEVLALEDNSNNVLSLNKQEA